MDKSRDDWPLSINQKCFDYLQVIQAWIKLSPLTFHFRHVKGHQTDKVNYNQLDWLENCNEVVDGMAKAFLHTCTASSPTNRKIHIQPISHLKKWTLAQDGTKFTSICRDSLYTNLYGSRTLAYWAKKDNISKDSRRILWEEYQLAMKRTSRAQQQINAKLLSNQCEFAKTIFDRKQQDTHTCPVCNELKEDRTHMFIYKGPTAVTNREKKLTRFKKVLDNLETASIIAKAIIGSLRYIYNGATPSIHSFHHAYFGGDSSIRGIIKDQTGIGWTNFLCGR